MKIKIRPYTARPEIAVGTKCLHFTEVFFWLTCVVFAGSLLLFKATSDTIDNGNRRLDAAQAHLDQAKLELFAVCGR